MNKTGFQIRNNYFWAALYIKLIVDNVKYRGIQCDFGRLTNVFFVTPDSLSFAVQRDTDFFQYTYYGRACSQAQKGVLNKAGITLYKYNMPRIKRECENPEPETGNRSLVTGHWSFVTCNLKSVTCNPVHETNENSTVLPAPLDPPEVNSGQALKGSTQISNEMEGSVRGDSPLGGRGSAGVGMSTMHECENPEPGTRNRESVTGHWSFVTCNLKPVTCNPEPETNENSTVFQIIKPSAIGNIFPAEGCISESQANRACLMIRIYNN